MVDNWLKCKVSSRRIWSRIVSWSFRIATISRNSETDGMQIDTSSTSNVYQIANGMMEVIIFLFPNDRLDRFVRESIFCSIISRTRRSNFEWVKIRKRVPTHRIWFHISDFGFQKIVVRYNIITSVSNTRSGYWDEHCTKSGHNYECDIQNDMEPECVEHRR